MTNASKNTKKIISIVSVDKNWGIGNSGSLLAHLPSDMKYFKETTIGNIVVMGRRTYESLPGAKPLPGRLNIVITRNNEYESETVKRGELQTAISVEDVVDRFRSFAEDNRDLYVIGGGEIYSQFLPFVDVCLVTKLDAAFDADTFFPNLDQNDDFLLVKNGEQVTEKGITYSFTEYSRVIQK